LPIFLPSVVDRHRFDADQDPNFHFDADPNPDLDRHQNDADPHADPIPRYEHVVENQIFLLLSHSISCLQCFIFLISVNRVVIFDTYFGQHIDIF
jgi:hypothetical protein